MRPQNGRTPVLGVHDDLGYDTVGAHRRAVIDAVATTLHAHISRSSFLWDQIERRPGDFDWSRYDSIVDDLQRVGIQPLFVVVGSPTWVNGHDTGDQTDRFFVPFDTRFAPWLASYDRFMRLAAARYRGKVWWEVWNEPNAPEFWRPQPDAAQYGQFFSHISADITAVDPEARIASGGVNHLLTDPDGGQGGLRFLQALVAQGVRPRAVAVHPYATDGHSPADDERGADHFADFKVVHTRLAAAGLDVPMWVTEWGWSSAEVGEASQATYLTQSIDVLRGEAYVAVAVVFVDYDRDAYPYGLLDASLRLKPAGRAFAQASAAA